jgi:hypothetical protein
MSSPDITLKSLLQSGLPPVKKQNINLISSPHVKTKHKPASLLPSRVDWPVDLPTPSYHGTIDVSSVMLDLRRARKTEFDYSTEADVQFMVSQLVADALEIMGVSEHFDRKLEYSLFSYRPDLVVVRHHFLGVVLVIEVKKPEPEPDQPDITISQKANKRLKKTGGVFDGELVAGQLYDYLKGMNSAGNPTPFAVLSTFESLVIAWLDAEETEDILSRELLQLGSDKTEISTPAKKSAALDSPHSPAPPAHAVVDLGPPILKQAECLDVDEEEFDCGPAECRQLKYSSVYKNKNALAALILALRCGMRAAEHRPTPRRLPNHGETMGGDCGQMNENGMEWKKLPETTVWDYQGVARSKNLFLWKAIGQGASGRAFLACSSAGKACVLKFVIYDDSAVSRLPDAEKKEKTEELLAETKKKVQAECDRWKSVYPEFTKHVRILKQNSLWALQMPYFNPVPVDKRESYLPQVRAVLEHFKHLGYSYRSGDLRWRHVGLKANGDCLLFDLESLEKIPEGTEINIQESMDLYLSKI